MGFLTLEIGPFVGGLLFLDFAGPCEFGKCEADFLDLKAELVEFTEGGAAFIEAGEDGVAAVLTALVKFLLLRIGLLFCHSVSFRRVRCSRRMSAASCLIRSPAGKPWRAMVGRRAILPHALEKVTLCPLSLGLPLFRFDIVAPCAFQAWFTR